MQFVWKLMFAMCLPLVNNPIQSYSCINTLYKKVFLFYEFNAMRTPVILLRLTVL